MAAAEAGRLTIPIQHQPSCDAMETQLKQTTRHEQVRRGQATEGATFLESRLRGFRHVDDGAVPRALARGLRPGTKLAVQRYFRGEINQQGNPGTQKFSKQQPFQNDDHDRASRNLVEQVNMKRELERLREQLNNSSESGDDLIRYQFLADGVRIPSSTALRSRSSIGHRASHQLRTWCSRRRRGTWTAFPFSSRSKATRRKARRWQRLNTPAATSRTRTGHLHHAGDRARDMLQDSGLHPDRFWRVIGYSDRVPLEA